MHSWVPFFVISGTENRTNKLIPIKCDDHFRSLSMKYFNFQGAFNLLNDSFDVAALVIRVQIANNRSKFCLSKSELSIEVILERV